MQAIERIARLYKVEAQAREMVPDKRLEHRQLHAQPLWDELHVWLRLERTRVPDGGHQDRPDPVMKNIELLILDGGDISVGAVYPIDCVATAADPRNTIAMLVRRDGETLNALLKRLDRAIGRFYDHDEIIDEVNGP